MRPASFFSILFLFLTLGFDSKVHALPTEALLTSIKGRVEVLTPGSPEWAPATDKQTITHNFRIRTRAGASCKLVFSQNDYVQLKERSSLLLNTSVHNDAKKLQRIFADLRGQFYFHLQDSTFQKSVTSHLYTPGIKISSQNAELRLDIVKDSLRYALQMYKGHAFLNSSEFVELKLNAGSVFYSQNQTNPGFGKVFGLDTMDVDTKGRLFDSRSRKKQRMVLREDGLILILPFQTDSLPAIKIPAAAAQNWNFGRFFANLAKENLAQGRRGSVSNLGAETDIPEIQAKVPDAEYLLRGNLHTFELLNRNNQWELSISMSVEIISMESGFPLTEEHFYKVYTANNDGNNNIDALGYLPLDHRNERIKQSIVGQLAKDLAKVFLRVSDPFN